MGGRARRGWHPSRDHKTGGIPESIPESIPGPQRDAIAAGIQQETLLGRAATLADVGNVAAFLASDRPES
jgi:enoyl-[acyl-carrier-protein] reductase (NADH)